MKDRTRQWHASRARRTTAELLTAVALPLTLATTGLIVAVQPTSAHAATTSQPSTIELPGLAAHPKTITLITGDQITLTPSARNRYTVSMQPGVRRDGTTGAVRITAQTSAAGASKIEAQPEDATSYVYNGSIDRGLFDISYLAGHDNTGQLPVVVQFTTPMSDAELAGKASELPASTLVQTLDSANAAEVDVDVRHAGEFWAVATGETPTGPNTSSEATLADGIAAMWLDGHRLGAPDTATPATEPLYTLTETVKARVGYACKSEIRVCPLDIPSVMRLDGADEGHAYYSSWSCVDPTSGCDTIRMTFHVPAGLYMVDGVYVGMSTESNVSPDSEEYFEVTNPELRVGNDTAIAYDLNNASKITVETPLPTDAYSGAMEISRTLPDGTAFAGVMAAGYHWSNYWAMPTPPVTTGTFFIKSSWTLGTPLVTMSVNTSHAFDLHPIYPFTFTPIDERFHGKQTLAVVDAGFGTADEFAKIDARGKLALVRNIPNGDVGCNVWRDTLQNALHAGAAGVLVDPTNPWVWSGFCSLPMYPEWAYAGFDREHVHIPFVEITQGDAQVLRERLGAGPLNITVVDTGEPSYLYELAPMRQGQIPASLTTIYGDKQLAEVDATYHASALPPEDLWSAQATDEFLIPGSDFLFVGSVHRKIYFGVTPELVYVRDYRLLSPDQGFIEAALKTAVYDHAGALGSEDWGDEPSPPGVPADPTGVRPGFRPFVVCSVCRQGNDFTPWAYLTSSDAPQQVFDQASWLAGLDPSTVHLYRDGQELAQTTNDYGASEYTLPSDSSQYKLTMDHNNVHSTWDFTSAAPVSDQTPAGYLCGSTILGFSGPCQAAPVIFLRYDSGTSADNTVSAPGAHQIHITAYHQDENAPAIVDLNVWTSIDGGKTWVQAPVTAQSGAFVAEYNVPDVSATDGSVSLKVQATDAGGNDVTQIINDAFQVAAVQQ